MKTPKHNASKQLHPGKRLEKKAPLVTYHLTEVHITGIQTSGPTPPPPPPQL